ncbi:serine protease inhibitor 28Dc [Tribolium madens]|uniref:serine protease inhibitor 28Dc n=1 Tax=Tribolium madens TaxID=41895 RepID=UPI001CF73B81|nr:serine protease inhibitor 28Dc [Tribolium madens]
MWPKKIIIISTLLPFLNGQLYFPDEKTGGYVQMQKEGQSEAILPTNLTELRGTTLYEQFVDKIVSSGILKLTVAMEKALIASSPNNYESIVFAPVNIAGALALVLLGSNGKTFEEISAIMGLATGVDIHNKSQLVHEQFGRLLEKLQTTSGFDIGRQVNIANAVFVQNNYPIRQIYKNTAESVYKSEVLNVDFETNPKSAQQVINAWVSERTKGKITQILNEVPDSSTKVILASALYFKAEWEKPFFDGSTKRRPFYTDGRGAKSDVMVEMMSNGGLFPYYKDRDLNCEIIGFPYKGNQTTMYVVIPNNSDKTKLKELEDKLDFKQVERLVSSVKYTGAIVIFPKMRIDTTIDLKKSLKILGISTLFNPAESNLALLSPGKGTPDTNPVIGNSIQNPISVNTTGNDVIIFNRNGEIVNCTQIFNPMSNVSTCEQVVTDATTPKKIVYKKFGNKVGRRIDGEITPRIAETLDNVRQYLNRQNNAERFENPGLYADNVIHKVYMDITESGTEAAASTSISLSRDGGRVTVRADVPFLFFIMHEETKTMLFWGSVNTPTPNFK